MRPVSPYLPFLGVSRPFLRIIGLIIFLALSLVHHPLDGADASVPNQVARENENPITRENQNPGSNQWQLGQRGFYVSDDVNGQIKGYASATSVNQGERISFYVTVNPVQRYTIDIYRIGWYNGAGGRLMRRVGPLTGVQQPGCPLDPVTGLVACNWTPSHLLTIPRDWTSGVYFALLTNSRQYQNYIMFVVRDDARKADLLYQQSVTTYQAYNHYPLDGRTGKSLYHGYGPATIAGDGRAVKVSFDRPYSSSYLKLPGGQQGAGWFLLWEIHFVRWIERSGYDVAYSTDIDTHAKGRQLRNYRGFLSVGHDEYWSKEMYDAAEAARDAGVNLAFFGANNVYWQVRFEPSANGAPNRVMVCYKRADIDPVETPSLKTVRWRDPLVNRPEQQLVGIQYRDVSSIVQGNGTAAYMVANSKHWIYEGTGFRDGDSVPGILGYETDVYMAEFPRPLGQSYALLSASPFVSWAGQRSYANSSIYQAPSGAYVFAAGTISWSWGLDKPGYADPRLQRTTANILNAFVQSDEGDHKVFLPTVLDERSSGSR